MIGLWAKVRNIRQGAAAGELADKFGIRLDGALQAPKAAPSVAPASSSVFTPIVPVPDNGFWGRILVPTGQESYVQCSSYPA